MRRFVLEEFQAIEQRKKDMRKLRESGVTYAEIANKYGISKQRVYQLIGGKDEKLFKPITTERCVYGGLRKWMNDNKVCVSELTRKIYGNYAPNSYERVKERLNGKCQFTKTYIDKILEITGLTYEEAFGGADNG